MEKSNIFEKSYAICKINQQFSMRFQQQKKKKKRRTTDKLTDRQSDSYIPPELRSRGYKNKSIMSLVNID